MEDEDLSLVLHEVFAFKPEESRAHLVTKSARVAVDVIGDAPGSGGSTTILRGAVNAIADAASKAKHVSGAEGSIAQSLPRDSSFDYRVYAPSEGWDAAASGMGH